MKKITLFFLLFTAQCLFSQGKVLDVFSSKILKKGNIQSESYFSTLELNREQGTSISTLHNWLRYGIHNSIEVQARISRQTNTNEQIDFSFSGLLPLSLGAKFHVFESAKSNIAVTAMSILPIGNRDIYSRDLTYGFHFDLAYERKMNDIYNLGVNLGYAAPGYKGLLNQTYILMNNEIAVTEWLDVYGQLEYYFGETPEVINYTLGAWLWVSEDIRVFTDYGIVTDEFNDNRDRLSFGLLMRWLD